MVRDKTLFETSGPLNSGREPLGGIYKFVDNAIKIFMFLTFDFIYLSGFGRPA